MKAKTILTTALVLFLLASLVVLVGKETRRLRTDSEPAAATEGRTKVVACYFHGNARCPTCLSLESYAKEAVQLGFPAEVKDGRIEWRAVNYEEAGNQHFAAEYQIVAPCLVLVAMRGRQPLQSKSLLEAWQHVGDKAEFIRCVRQGVREFLSASDGGRLPN